MVYSSEIDGIQLNVDQVRSSIARKLGIENVKYSTPSHYVDSVVGAVLHYDMPFNKEKLCAWQAAFFPSGFSEGSQIEIGQYRTNEEHIVSGMFGREKIHYITPSPDRIEEEMKKFLACFDGDIPYIKALYKGRKPICERILKLDAERFQKGDLSLSNLLSKYCLYMATLGGQKL